MRCLPSTLSRAGLLQEFDLSEALSVRDFDIEAPVLVLWKTAGAEIDVRQSQRRHWHYRPRPGSLDLYAPGRYDSFRSSHGRRHLLVLHTSPCWWQQACDRGDGALPAPILPRMQFRDRALERLMQSLQEHQSQGEPVGPMFSDALTVAIMDRLASHGEANTEAEPDSEAGPHRPLRPALRRLLEALIEHRLSEPMSIDTMAMLASMGTSLFLRAFRASFGMSPHQYVLALRIERAKQWLRERNASLSDLAARLGFSSHAHFTTVFHARTGSTPSDYRRVHAGALVGTSAGTSVGPQGATPERQHGDYREAPLAPAAAPALPIP